jgi:cytochrome c5
VVKIILGIARQKTLTGMMAVITLFAASTVWSLTPGEQRIVDRIKPVSSVCIEGEACEGAQTAAVAASASGPRSGADIYGGKCFACHDTGAAGAPKFGDVMAWSARLDKGLEKLVANAISGINGMPPKGTCGDCTDEEIAATVEYMVENSK